MQPISEKSTNPSRTLVWGLLAGCFNTAAAGNCRNCPLRELHNGLSVDEKHDFVMELTDREIESVLEQHEACYQKRLADLDQW